MAADDLNAPLGQNARKRKKRFELPIAVPQAVAGALGLCLAGVAGWALVVDDPLGGEPVAVVSTGPTGPAMPVVVQGPRSYDGPGPSQAAPAAAPKPPPGTQTVTIIDGSTGKRQDVSIPAPQDKNASVDQRMFEASRHGNLPRIGPDGARPSDVYARPVKPMPGKPEGARIAIVIGGLGISASATQAAFTKLPPAVTLAFTPYGADIEKLVTRARADGREVLLQVPMEPFDYPDNDPGPQTLLSTLPTEQNLDRLHWQMSRFPGYVGLSNLMGARFTSSEAALSPVLREVAKRGLIYFDDGSSPRSLASQIAGTNHLPFAKADVVLDAVPTPVNIDRALTRLEAIARERGTAVGFLNALPIAIDRIALWVKAAEARGMLLVPISAVAVAKKAKSS